MKNFRQYIMLELSVERAEKVITGLAQDVQSVGIMTPMNPQAKNFPPDENKLFVSQFIDFVRSRGYDPIEVGGKFSGNEERSFLLKNISRKELINLGKMYDQQSVIWGSKASDERGTPHFHYEYIEGGKTTSKSYRLEYGKNAQDRQDNYSTIKGKKFVIPFFQPDSERH